MSETKIISLNSKELADISQVGGKGYSLIKLSSLNLNVPPGIVLTVGFFEDWIKKIKNSDLYKEFILQLSQNNNECQIILNKIKDWSLNNLVLSSSDKQDIEDNLKKLFPDDYNKILYAVRSSSPEEDLAGASFAGNYETYLGTQFDLLEEFILKSFISCIDYRVFKYKLEKGFTASDIKIAIVIMKQVNCDVSGVGFSINPLNNDYDEAVITSNFGLGESVVGGIITPDEYIVNKISKKVITEKLGSKDKIVKLNEDNGTSVLEQNSENQKKSSLSKEQIIQIVDKIIVIENSYNVPIDIEFGIENDILYILQARPITTYNKLPEEFLTKPNEQRQLYFDVTVGVQGFEEPMTTFGSDVFKLVIHTLAKLIPGIENIDNLKESAFDGIGGKLLLNLSNVMTKFEIETITNYTSNINNLISETLLNHGSEYKNKTECKALKINKFNIIRKVPIIRVIFAKYFAKSSKSNFENQMSRFITESEEYIQKNIDSNVPIFTILEHLINNLVTYFRSYAIPVLANGIFFGYMKLKNLFEPYLKDNSELRQDFNNLIKCFPFVTILMGLDTYKLSTYLDKNQYKNKTQDEFYQDYLDKKFPKEFYIEFETFMKKYGFRGEGEIDIVNKRYSENPKTIINQVFSALLEYDESNNPQKDFDDTNSNRPEIFRKLYKFASKKGFASEFEKAYFFTVNFFQYRESPKYYIVFVIGSVRKLILKRAEVLLQRNLIDDIDDIFKLKIKSLDHILENVDVLTKEKVGNKIHEDNKCREIITTWKRQPIMFDSRGRIFSHERKEASKKNQLIGDSVSYGKVRGKAKVLKTVNEKVFNPGEILVTKATDPGWTPLIINCGGIILEVGGMLQHGALVSREFNKPCVVGIENITDIIKDGEEIEVDAIEGIITLLDREE
ncbi:glutathione synthetase ATP-binding domain-like protein [Neocallimastix lanati (nom. inval.)]|uniref:Glutathione synthetase ATP-binding domain-like protein n=1 Tax=Neocallimastix californiae TaxID=1754190 RepID=A0A1Y1ZNF6_9FUNG|nr:glutathione synthetase ATP-binding domain-like protein [Neocallimastix sp. JGI-2020a]ORY11766.1 glutathione synthetase ATP-binding domain-like protein [Neocallimastix californiae]|eukprot:ORY11766.1 glutathione synthetase ATP-binding domain-like protein [Neocallimastix californiae]